jgi:uncharacterized protein
MAHRDRARALIVWGGWLGHQPEQVAHIFAGLLESGGVEVDITTSLDRFLDRDDLRELDLIVPIWTMGSITREQADAVAEAVGGGVGVAGCHGGMCDAFRDSVQWQFMTGGNWVAHPGGDRVEYRVEIVSSSNPLVQGIEDFDVTSEQYYLHVDPAVEVLATTRFPTVRWYHSTNRAVDMPVVWTKRWGHGRVFYNSLGHQASVFDVPEAREIMRRGLFWALEGRALARERGASADDFRSDLKMF